MFNIYRMLFLALKKVRIVKCTPRKFPQPSKNLFYGKICNYSHLGGFPFTPDR